MEITNFEIDNILKNEPNHAFFAYEGLVCEVKRHDEMLHFCGYVFLPEDHPWFSYEPPVRVHGGVTFGRAVHNEWILGFDCGHGGDLIPRMRQVLPLGMGLFENEIYRDFDYVSSECKRLAEQCWDICDYDMKKRYLDTISQRLAVKLLSL